MRQLWLSLLVFCGACAEPTFVDCGTYVCPVGLVCAPGGRCVDVIRPCGDSVLDTSLGETCDDGNTQAGDGCSADCRSTEQCGNGFHDVAFGEACDDANADDNDGCRANCTRPFCGDGIRDPQEACDAGSVNSDAPDAACRTNCQLLHCGDGVLDVAAGERCDDGNTSSGDGCSADCRSTEICGNAIIDVGEQCDDGNLLDNDACHGNCQIPHCGDAMVDLQNGETCDDGAANSNAPDASCRINCQPRRCGDGIHDLAANEVCDDANVVSGDGCSGDCKSDETCGNNYIDAVAGEQCDDANPQGLSYDGCSSVCTVEPLAWQPVRTMTDLNAHAMVYDEARRAMVVFGGAPKFGSAVDETWEFDGSRWALVQPSSRPPARTNARLVYDMGHERVLLFGGTGPSGILNDTWEYDGVAWREINTGARPPARYRHGMAFDAGRQRTVVFGGQGSGPLRDTWEFDGSDWTQVDTLLTPPHAMSAPIVTYDAARQNIVLVASEEATSTWIYDGTEWTPRPTINTVPRWEYGQLAYDSARQISVWFGRDQTWEYDGDDWTARVTATIPPRRNNSFAFAYDATQQKVVLFGGDYTTGFSDTWWYDGVDWQQRMPSTAPPVNVTPAGAWDTVRGRFVMLGDVNGGGTWEFDGRSWISIAPTSSPPGRGHHAMAFDSARRRIVLFAGYLAYPNTNYDDTWEYDGVTWTQISTPTKPPARMSHAMAFDSLRQKTVVFGGSNNVHGAFDDTWEYDGASWSQVSTANQPPTLVNHAMSFDPARNKMVLFGGSGSVTYYDGTWEYDGSDWTLVDAPIHPAGRRSHAMAYDAQLGGIILFGGQTTALFGDTWKYNGEWTQLAPSASPSPRYEAIMAYDPLQRRLFLAAGINGSPLKDLWSLGFFQGNAPADACRDATIDSDQDGLLGCDDPDCAYRCTPLCSPLTSCDLTTQAHCGDGICHAEGFWEDPKICPTDC